jgi:hypothetical protein
MCLSGGDESLAGAWSDGVAAPEIDGAGSVLDATQSSGMRNGFGAVGLGGNRMRVYVTCVGLDASVNTRNLRTVCPVTVWNSAFISARVQALCRASWNKSLVCL